MFKSPNEWQYEQQLAAWFAERDRDISTQLDDPERFATQLFYLAPRESRNSVSEMIDAVSLNGHGDTLVMALFHATGEHFMPPLPTRIEQVHHYRPTGVTLPESFPDMDYITWAGIVLTLIESCPALRASRSHNIYAAFAVNLISNTTAPHLDQPRKWLRLVHGELGSTFDLLVWEQLETPSFRWNGEPLTRAVVPEPTTAAGEPAPVWNGANFAQH